MKNKLMFIALMLAGFALVFIDHNSKSNALFYSGILLFLGGYFGGISTNKYSKSLYLPSILYAIGIVMTAWQWRAHSYAGYLPRSNAEFLPGWVIMFLGMLWISLAQDRAKRRSDILRR